MFGLLDNKKSDPPIQTRDWGDGIRENVQRLPNSSIHTTDRIFNTTYNGRDATVYLFTNKTTGRKVYSVWDNNSPNYQPALIRDDSGQSQVVTPAAFPASTSGNPPAFFGVPTASLTMPVSNNSGTVTDILKGNNGTATVSDTNNPLGLLSSVITGVKDMFANVNNSAGNPTVNTPPNVPPGTTLGSNPVIEKASGIPTSVMLIGGVAVVGLMIYLLTKE